MFNESFHKNLGFVQYNAALTITCAFRATGTEKLYQEVGLEFSQNRLKFRRLY